MSTSPSSLLVVDDEPYILDTLSRILANDFQVFTAMSAKEAREVFSRHPVHVIIADQKMPVETGVELLEWVRQNHPKTIRLMMTGFADFEITVKAINRGQIYRMILKPWRTDELILILQSAARLYQLERSHEQLMADLQKLNSELEGRVEVRTRELEEAVRQLHQKNSMLEKLSLTDALTGLPNRRAMDRVAEAEIRRRARHATPLGLGLVDVDHFKQVNSEYLLPGGDHVLTCLGQVLASSIRMEDTVGRVGGEEFLVVAPETNPEGAVVLGERIRQMVERAPIHYQDQAIRITVSVGFGVVDATSTASYAQLRHIAAAALEEAKRTGRNRCIVSPLSPQEPGVT